MADNADIKPGFWVRFWVKHGRGSSQLDETYRFLLYEDGYTKKDEDEFIKDFVYQWAQYDMQGCNHDYYDYGYDIINSPPLQWIDKEIIEKTNKKAEIDKCIELLRDCKTKLFNVSNLKPGGKVIFKGETVEVLLVQAPTTTEEVAVIRVKKDDKIYIAQPSEISIILE